MKPNNKYFDLTFVRVYIISQTLTRLLLFVYALISAQVSWHDLPQIIASGLANDYISLCYALPPVILLTTFATLLLRRFQLPLVPIAVSFYFILVMAMIFNLISELAFWDEFGTRYNFIAVDYLIYTQEVIGTVTESMPIFKIISGIVIASILICLFSLRYLYAQTKSISYLANLKLLVLSFVMALLAFKFYDSSQVTLSTNVYAQELSKNGPYEFVSAFRNNSLDYKRFYPSLEANEAMKTVRDAILQPNQKFLSEDGVERNVTSLERAQAKHKGLVESPETLMSSARESIHPNIVLITVESLSAEYMAAFGSGDDVTPYLDKLANESVFFTNLYAVGTRTVRGLEALTLSAPPTPGSSIMRRMNNHGLFNIATPLKANGYEATFFYGGYGYFDNMDNYFSGNGYKVFDRGNLKSSEITASNIWGVADEDILRKVITNADESYKTGRPFFSLVMTTSNHRPYTFPEGRIDRPSGSGRLGAVKYTDYAIGQFIEEARTKPWFDNTIFVIVADHCASSAGKTHLPINKYHIPLIIYGPKLIEPKRVTNLTSQIDVPTTILGMMDIDYKSKFMGRDALRYPADRAFIGTYQLLGYMKDNHLVILAPKTQPQVYSLDKGEQSLVGGREDLVREAISFYQVTYGNFISGKMKE
jgi:phosphoglycerol transferase MdoB-like AlkP superfamily enzyme